MSTCKMACVENIIPGSAESEMEEGEIVDELDDLSDISSEEEFLLRQRLEVLENYNNVLERKEAKRTSETPGHNQNKFGKGRSKDVGLLDLSEVSTSELEDVCRTTPQRKVKDLKPSKTSNRLKTRKDFDIIHYLGRDKKKVHRKKKKVPLKIISKSSDESEDEYRNKRRKLANAVTLHKDICDKSSLKTRLNNMLHGVRIDPIIRIDKKVQREDHIPDFTSIEKQLSPSRIQETEIIKTDKETPIEHILIDSSSDDDVIECQKTETIDTVDAVINREVIINVDGNKSTDEKRDSDEDLEVLRQHALKTKATKRKQTQETSENKPNNSEDEDSDTAELRLICLKSALLKKAIEMKQKQKLQKRSSKISQSSNLHDELLLDRNDFSKNIESGDNTDIESVDMEIGSDTEDKGKDISEDSVKNIKFDETNEKRNIEIRENAPVKNIPRQEELDEDEDLLRAKLLTSLSKNLSNLIEPSEVNENRTPMRPPILSKTSTKVPEEKKIIINLGESDSEGEHEATKNLTKMHMKLSEQVDFQNRLDLFLKSARMEVEKTKLPDVVLKPDTPTKYVPKAVNHLPKSEQMEYQNLVKRMEDLEKIKQVRQAAMENMKTKGLPLKDKLKPRNVSVENTNPAPNKPLETHIALSRKKIAEESATIMKLKEESLKLAQKFKIVATEYRNIATAIALNKKELKNAQIRLSKVRTQHQLLLKSDPLPNTNSLPTVNRVNNKVNNANRLQKENYPKEEYKNSELLKKFKVSVVNDLKNKEPAILNNHLSIQIDVSSNKKTVKIPKSTDKDRLVNKEDNSDQLKNSEQIRTQQQIGAAKCGEDRLEAAPNNETKAGPPTNDYQSPLQALQSVMWMEDPNAILCPFEVGGNCKDPDCKYMHPKSLPNH